MDGQPAGDTPAAVDAMAVEVRAKVSSYPAPFLPRVAGRRKGTVKLLAFGQASWQAEGDAGTEVMLPQQPR